MKWVLLLVVATVAAVAAVQTDSKAEEHLESFLEAAVRYGVLHPGAHEYVTCRALLIALDAEEKDGKLSKCSIFQDLRNAFPSNFPCPVVGLFGAGGASVAEGWQEMIDSADKAIVDTVNSFTSGTWRTIKAAATAVVDKAKAAGAAAGKEFGAIKKAVGSELNVVGKKIASLTRFKRRAVSESDLYQALTHGSREPDLPCLDRDLGHNCVIDLGSGAARSKVTEIILTDQHKPKEVVETLSKNSEIEGFSPSARASHFGALSIGHAQTAWRPGPDNLGVFGVVEALQNPKIFKDAYDFGYSRAPIANPTQQDVANAMIDLLSHFYKMGIPSATSAKLEGFVLHFSRISHSTADSFSCSHTIRDADTLELLYFQDYGAQNGEKHTSSGDALTGSSPFNPPVPLAGFKKAQEHAAVSFRTGMREICTAHGIPYASVTGGNFKSGLDEMRNYYQTQVLKFAGDFFANFPAKGCVTASSMSADAVKKNRVCSWDDTVKAVKKDNLRVCPDKPTDKAAFTP